MGLTVDTVKLENNYIKASETCSRQSNEPLFDYKQEAVDTVDLPSKKEEEESSDNLMLSLTGIACAAVMGFLYLRGIKNDRIFKSMLKGGSSNYGVIRAMEPKNFNKIKALSALSKEERMLLNDKLRVSGYGEQELFFATLKGDKPSSIVSLPGRDLEFLNKVNTRGGAGNFDFLHIPDESTPLCFVLNKNKVLEVIDRNKSFYTARLNLDANSSSEIIYEKLAGVLQKDYLAYHDLTGVTLGFSRKNSMIFELGRDIPPDIARYDTQTYKTMLLDKLYSADSPYKGLKKSELDELANAIRSYSPENKCLPDNGLYFFKAFVNEPEEFARIVRDSENFEKNFKAKDLF